MELLRAQTSQTLEFKVLRAVDTFNGAKPRLLNSTAMLAAIKTSSALN